MSHKLFQKRSSSQDVLTGGPENPRASKMLLGTERGGNNRNVGISFLPHRRKERGGKKLRMDQGHKYKTFLCIRNGLGYKLYRDIQLRVMIAILESQCFPTSETSSQPVLQKSACRQHLGQIALYGELLCLVLFLITISGSTCGKIKGKETPPDQRFLAVLLLFLGGSGYSK